MRARGAVPKRQVSERVSIDENRRTDGTPNDHQGRLHGAMLIESTVEREILQSEKRRVTLMIAVLSLLLLFTLTIFLAPQLYAPDARSRLRSVFWPLILIVMSYLVYEGVIRLWIDRLLATNRTPHRAYRYANVLIEVSLPTAALLVTGFLSDPLSTLAGAVPFIYFVLIVLVALNLDFYLCLFAGAIACIEFLTISLFLVSKSAGIPNGRFSLSGASQTPCAREGVLYFSRPVNSAATRKK